MHPRPIDSEINLLNVFYLGVRQFRQCRFQLPGQYLALFLKTPINFRRGFAQFLQGLLVIACAQRERSFVFEYESLTSRGIEDINQ